MAITKIVDDMRTTVALDATKVTTGTLPEARINSLDSTKLTGTIAVGRLGNAPATDLTPVKNDISLLALQNAINGNLSAYGLKNSWIEQFENSTYIENLTTVIRSSAEYVSSASSSLGTPTYYYGSWAGSSPWGLDRNPWITATSDMSIVDGTVSNILDGSGSNNNTGAFQWSGGLVGKYLRFQFTDNNSTGSTKKLITEAKFWTYGNDAHGTWKWQGSDDATTWTDIGSNFPLTGSGSSSTGLLTSLSGNTTAYTYYQVLGVSGVVQTGSTKWVAEMEFKAADETFTSSATGSFNSTDVIPQAVGGVVSDKSEVGLVILYKDGQAGTTTFNGANQLVAKVRANTGQAYQEVVLTGAGTYSDGLKIAIAPAISVTAGQALSYEISFAGQSNSLETRVHGIAMTY